MARIKSTTMGMLLVVAGSNAACVHATELELESPSSISPQNVMSVAPRSCVNTAPMPIIGLKVGAPKPPPPAPQYNMPIIRLSACYLEIDSGVFTPRIYPKRDTIPPTNNQKQ